jgi:glucuronoarabinoxylan endo-1,4-beta-xylanase
LHAGRLNFVIWNLIEHLLWAAEDWWMRNTAKPRTQRLLMPELLERRTLLSAATINWADVHQSVDGFGASSAWMSTPFTSTVLTQLYSTTAGAGLSILRTRIAPNGTTTENTIMQQMAPYGVRVISTDWTPPREWKTNDDNNNGGTLIAADYQNYANMLADFVQNAQALGVPIYALSPQNEPDLSWCVWTADQFAAFLPYLAQAFSSRGITTKIELPESFRWDFSLANEIMADPSLSQYVGILAAHNYDSADYPYVPITGTLGKPVWMSEVTIGNGTSQINDAVALADDIHKAFTVAGVSAYNYWWINSTSNDELMTNFVPNKRLWSLGNYSRFVRPGWEMIGETDDGGLDVTAFKDPVSGKFAIVAANTSTTAAVNETFTLNGVSAGSVTPYITSATDNLAQYASISVTGGSSFTDSIAANSVVTFTGISSAAPAVQTPDDFMAAAQYQAETNAIALSWADNSSTETGETLQRSTSPTDWTSGTTFSLAAGTTSYVNTGLSENTTYYYRIESNNGGTSSAWSSGATASTVLAAPSNVSATTISGGLKVSWTINSAASSGVTVQRSLDGITWSTIATLSTRATNYSDTIAGYNANQIYYYRVRNTLGSSSSAYASYNTTLLTPTNFTAATVGPASITLTWTNVAVGASGAQVQELSGSTWNTISPSALTAAAGTYTVTGLTENTQYSFRLAALSDADSISSANTSTLVLTAPVAAPTRLTALSTGSSTAQLSWADNSSIETGYSVERSIDGTNWTVLTTTPLAANTISYTDSSVPAGTVYYRVRALTSGASSAYARTQLVATAPAITTSVSVTGTTSSLSTSTLAGFGSGTLIYTWSLDGTPPALVNFSSNGTTSSNSTTATYTVAGSYTFRITITDAAGDSTTGSTTVTVVPTLSSISVAATASLPYATGGVAPTPAIIKNTWQQLTATGLDQFATALASQPTVTWSVVSGGGSVSTSGLYAAPSSAASPIVRATSGSVSGQITLSVVNSAQLIADYGFNEGNGTNASDTTGSAGVTGKISGGATFVTGRMGKAIQFDGSTGSVWLGNPSSLDIRGQITMAAWIKPASSSGTQTIISRGYGPWPNQSGTFLRIASGQYQVGFYDGGYHYASYAVPSGDIGNWVHLVGTYDGKNWNLYRDGTLVATYANTKGSMYAPNSWRIGNTDSSPSPSNYFGGTIDSVRLYGQALSASDVSALYNQTIIVTAAASASATTVTTASTNLSVAAVDPDTNSDALFTYTWSMTSGPAAVSYSINGSNAAKNTTVTFTAAGSYTFKATVLDASGLSTTSNVTVTVVNTLPAWMGGGSAAWWNPSTKVLNVTGAASIIADPGTDEPIIQGSASAAQISVNPTSGTQIHIGGISLSNGAWLTVTSLGSARTAGNHRVLILGTGSSAIFSIDSTSTLDLTDNDLIVRGGDPAAIASQLISGYSSSGGYWNGPGIISSIAAHDSTLLTTVGILLNTTGSGTVYTTFDGVSGLTTSDVLVKYTYYGDADLSGSVTGQDYSIIDAHHGQSGMDWSQGDFNYDGHVDGSDYSLIDNAFNLQGSGGLTSPLNQVTAPPSLPAITDHATLRNTFLANHPPPYTTAPAIAIFCSLPIISGENDIVLDDLRRHFWERMDHPRGF